MGLNASLKDVEPCKCECEEPYKCEVIFQVV